MRQPLEIPGLTKANLAELGREIGKAGLLAPDFAVGQVRTDFAGAVFENALVHRPSGNWFAFARYLKSYGYSEHVEDEGHYVGYVPGQHSPFAKSGPLDWPEVVREFARWLVYMQKELSAASFEDAVAAGARESVNRADSSANAPFTAPERSQIESVLSRIEESLRASEQARRGTEEFVRAEFSALREELAKMKRGRWKNLFTGSLVKLAAERIVATEVAQEAFATARDFVAEGADKLLR